MESNEELQFTEDIEAIMAPLQRILAKYKGEGFSLKRFKYQMENNQATIISQQKEIVQNKAIIDDAKGKAQAIIAQAEARAKEIEKTLQEHSIIINAQEKQAKEALAAAEKVLFDAKLKKKQLVEA